MEMYAYILETQAPDQQVDEEVRRCFVTPAG